MDDHEDRVNDLLEQCVDHAALRLSTVPSDALDADLLARLQRLKAAPLAPNPPLVPRVDADGLQSDLAERLAALKKNPSKPPAPEIIKAAKISNLNRTAQELHEGDAFEVEKKDPSKSPAPEIIKAAKISYLNRTAQESHEGDAFEVEKLLESVLDSVRLEKSGASKSNHNSESDEEVSDSEVDHIVEWAKDAAVLEEDEDDDEWAKGAAVLKEDEEGDASDADLPTQSTSAHSPQRKKKGSRWKFW